MTDQLTIPAPAKLNLYLHVTGKRADGYHLLDSLVAFAELGDVLTLRPADGLTLRMTGPFAGPLRAEDPERNLAVRAVRALAAHLGREADLEIVLDKRLPVASGIGGGSADAAAALSGAARLWGVAADDPELYRLARSIGADVPVCLYARTAYFAGTGEEIAPGPVLPTVWLVLANPGVALETRTVFAARTAPFTAPARLTRDPADAADLAAMLMERGNDLAAPAAALCPVIGEVLDRLAGADGCLMSRMSGSGATCFGLFATEEGARAAAAGIAADQPGWWVRPSRLLR